MAVTISSSSFGNQNFAGTNSLTWSHTHGGGPLVVVLATRGTTPVGVTANGVAMTARGSNNGTNDCVIQGWTLDNIAAFTGNIVVDYGPPGTEVYIAGGQAFSIAGASASPFGTAVTAFATNDTAPSVTVSSAAARLVIACLASVNATVTHTIGSGQTLAREDVATGGGDNTLHIRMFTSTEGGAASVVMNGTLSGTTNWSGVSFDIAEAAAGGNDRLDGDGVPLKSLLRGLVS